MTTGKKTVARIILVVVVVLLAHHFGCGKPKCENSEGYEVSIPSGQHKNSAGLCEVDLTEAQKAAERKAKRAVAEQRAQHSPQLTVQLPPWTTQTLTVSDKTSVHLYQGWKASALDGAITITAPDGEIIHDAPGKMRDVGFQPTGWYVFAPDPAGSERSVQVYNRW